MSIDIALKLSVSLALSSSTHCYGEKKKLRSGVRSHSLYGCSILNGRLIVAKLNQNLMLYDFKVNAIIYR